MMLAAVLIIVSAIVLIAVVGLITHLSSRGNVGELQSKLVPIDVNAFRNLLEPSEEAFLRENLAAPTFRQVHRLRMRAAMECAWSASRNAGMLIRIAEAARSDSDPSVVKAAETLIDNATHLRLYAMGALPRFGVSLLLPGVGLAPSRMPEMYESISRQMVILGCLTLPAREVAL